MPKVNGFVMYMESVKSVVAPGQALKRNELAVLCADGWKDLPEEERRKFTEQAKRHNERANRGGGQGAAPNQVPRQISENPEKGNEADYEIIEAGRKTVCQIFEQTDWRKQPIVVCHFSLYCEPDHAEHFIPAEIGLSTFSLQNGVIDNFSRIIEPGKLPQGYGIEANTTAENLGLPQLDTIPDFANYESTMMTVDSYLKKYMIKLSRGKNMYVFAFDSEFVRVKRCFEWLFEKTGYRLPVKILSLDLWCYLSTNYGAKEASVGSTKAVGAVFQKQTKVVAKTNRHREPDKPLIGKFVYHSRYPMCAVGIFLTDDDVDDVIRDVDNYRCFEEMCCIYHLKNGLQIQHCALLMANRYAFSILEIITLSNEVPIIRGHHFPEIDKPHVEKARRYSMLRKWGITAYEEQMEERRHEDIGPPTPPGRGFHNARERREDWDGERRNRGPPRRRRDSGADELEEQTEEVEGEERYSPARAAYVRKPGPRNGQDSQNAAGPRNGRDSQGSAGPRNGRDSRGAPGPRTGRDSQGSAVPRNVRDSQGAPGHRNGRDSEDASPDPEDAGLRLYKIREEEDDEDEHVSEGYTEAQVFEEKGEPNVFTGNVPSFFGKPQKQKDGDNGSANGARR